MAKPNGPEIANRNEMEVLKALHRFSWLRTRDIASLIWSKKRKRGKGLDLSPLIVSESAMRMAQKTLARLREKKQVNSMRVPDMSVVYGLAEGGARRLRNHGFQNVVNGEDALRRISLSFYHHRRIANEVAILGIIQGFNVITEYEVASGKWFGGNAGIHSKKPDVLVQDENGLWIWIEVERSRRNAKDYQRLMDFLKASWPPGKNIWTTSQMSQAEKMLRVCFICEPYFIEKVLADLKQTGWQNDIVKHRIASVALPYITEARFIVRQ